MKLEGKVAIVTGSGQGLGRAIALRLARDGASIVIADQNAQTAAQVAGEIEARGGQVLALETDVSVPESVTRMVEKTTTRFGGLDVLVNNAGIGQNIMPAVELSLEEWNRVLAVNLTGTLLCCQEAARYFMQQRSGRIVNLSSINGLSPAVNCIAYNVSKAAVISLTKSLAKELAAYGVNVNAICPGPVYTDLNRTIMSQRAARRGISQEEMVERVRAMVPMGRWVEEEDIAGGVSFLVSDDASYVSGAVLTVTGGLSGV